MVEEYPEFVSGLFKDGAEIFHSIAISGAAKEKMEAMHAAVGVSGEAGELLDAVKRWVIRGRPLDRENVIEELGDILFFVQAMANVIDVTMEELVEANMDKLGVRFPDGYSDVAAEEKADHADNKQHEGEREWS